MTKIQCDVSEWDGGEYVQCRRWADTISASRATCHEHTFCSSACRHPQCQRAARLDAQHSGQERPPANWYYAKDTGRDLNRGAD